MKAKSRFLGIDDAPFRFSDETVPIVGVAAPFRRLARTTRDHSAARNRGNPDGPWIGVGDIRWREPNGGPRGALAYDRPRRLAGTAARRPSHRGGNRPWGIAGTRLTRCDHTPLT